MPNTKNGTHAQATVPTVTGDPAIDAAIQDVNNGLAAVSAQIGQPLTREKRKRLARVRRNGQQLIEPLIQLASRHPQLVPVGMSPTVLVQQLLQHQRQLVLLAVVEAMAKAVGDTTVQGEADLWTAALAIYGIASHSVATDPDVAGVVAQMEAALANGPRKDANGQPKKKSTKKSAASDAGASGTTAAPVAGTEPGTSTGSTGSTPSVPVYYPTKS